MESFHSHQYTIDVKTDTWEFSINFRQPVLDFFEQLFWPGFVTFFDIKECCLRSKNDLDKCKRMIYAFIDFRYYKTYIAFKKAVADNVLNKVYNTVPPESAFEEIYNNLKSKCFENDARKCVTKDTV